MTRKLSLLEVFNNLDFLDADFLTLRDILKKNYSKSVLKIIKIVKELEALNKIKKWGIASSEPIGYGAAGVVFPSVREGCVVKVSSDSHDYESAKKFAGLDIPNIAKVISLKKLPLPESKEKWADWGEFLYFVEMEQLNPIDGARGEFFSGVLAPLAQKLDDESKRFNAKHQERLSRKLHDQVRQLCQQHGEAPSSPENADLLSSLEAFLKNIHDQGFHFGDRQASQFMISKDGKLKLVDFGSIRKNEK